MKISVTIPGPPVPKYRPRLVRSIHDPVLDTIRKRARAYTPAKSRDYERHVRACASATSMQQRWPKYTPGDEYAVTMQIYFPDARRRDLTNVAKSVEDACNGILWYDDSEIIHLELHGVVDRVRPRVELHVLRCTKAKGTA
jgi:Holliday junction resolvase RusA-like endonuclease